MPHLHDPTATRSRPRRAPRPPRALRRRLASAFALTVAGALTALTCLPELPTGKPAAEEGRETSRARQLNGPPAEPAPGRSSRPGLLGDDPSGLPVVFAAEPDALRLEAPGRVIARLTGRWLEQVTRIRVVTALGAPVADIEARLLPPPAGGVLDSLTVELTAARSVPSGRYRLQLNTDRGGIYLPANLAEIVVAKRPS